MGPRLKQTSRMCLIASSRVQSNTFYDLLDRLREYAALHHRDHWCVCCARCACSACLACVGSALGMLLVQAATASSAHAWASGTSQVPACQPAHSPSSHDAAALPLATCRVQGAVHAVRQVAHHQLSGKDGLFHGLFAV